MSDIAPPPKRCPGCYITVSLRASCYRFHWQTERCRCDWCEAKRAHLALVAADVAPGVGGSALAQAPKR